MYLQEEMEVTEAIQEERRCPEITYRCRVEVAALDPGVAVGHPVEKERLCELPCLFLLKAMESLLAEVMPLERQVVQLRVIAVEKEADNRSDKEQMIHPPYRVDTLVRSGTQD